MQTSSTPAATNSAGSGSNSAISDPLFRQNPRQRGRPLAQGQPAASPSLPPNLYAGYYSPAARSPVSLRALSLAWLQRPLAIIERDRSPTHDLLGPRASKP